MTTLEEKYQNVKKCKCGCTDLVIEITNYYFIKRDKKLNIIDEYDGDEKDIKITCRDCEKELKE